MAHIVNCIADFDASHKSKPAPPQLSSDPKLQSTTRTDKPPHWRMQQSDTQPRYQLFPRERQLPVLNSGKCLDPEKAFAVAMSQTGDKGDKQSVAAGLRIRINQHSLIRRRKISVPELGPMTTVQEVSMDSPTIPGRPALHERSISAPGTSLRKHQLADTFLCTSPSDDGHSILSAVEEALQKTASRQLAPLVIPQTTPVSPQIRRQPSRSHCRTGSESSRMTRTDESPRSRTPLQTPNTSVSDTTTSKFASAHPTSYSMLSAPVSAPMLESRTSSPKPWDSRCTTPVSAGASVPARGHRRGASESSSIMDRGRPRKRLDVRNNNGPLLKSVDSKRSKSSERRAFEELPKGYRPAAAAANIESSELAKLQKQAFGQVDRFEVLKMEDVESLSKELRHLDERTEYIRRTYNSLRAGRRNLHSRICQYLRSPRTANFSHDSMLKQEEALAELDASIDDWVNKLERAENRRTRVRQKLLEHVAAAAYLSFNGPAACNNPSVPPVVCTATSSIGNISTPPRSPTKQSCISNRVGSASPSPIRVVAQVPSTIFEQPIIEEAARLSKDECVKATSMRASNAESIRIYAGDDVYALLADVEDEITRMSKNVKERVVEEELPEKKRMELHRKKSREMLNGLTGESATKVSPLTTRPPTPPESTPKKPEAPADEGLILLTNAVFKP